MIKKMKKLITMAGVIAVMFILRCLPVYAADLEQVTENMVLETSTETLLYESPTENSAVIATLPQGTTVITISQAENGWCEVFQKDMTGYVRLEQLKSIGDKAALDQEFRQNADNDEMLMNELERIRSQKLRSRIWGTIIVVLVVAMFAVGIFSAKKKNEEEAMDDSENEFYEDELAQESETAKNELADDNTEESELTVNEYNTVGEKKQKRGYTYEIDNSDTLLQ